MIFDEKDNDSEWSESVYSWSANFVTWNASVNVDDADALSQKHDTK